MNVKTQKLERAVYLAERQLSIEAEQRLGHSFDKALLSLSAGALGLSIAYLKNISLSPPKSPVLLYLSWISLGLTILFMLFALIAGQGAHRRHRELLEVFSKEDVSENKHDNCYASITNALNWFSIISFTSGVVFLALFSIINLQG